MKTKILSLISLSFVFCLLYLNSEGNKPSSQNNDYTFCYRNISVTLFDGGNAVQIRYDLNGTVVKRVSGEWNAYGSPNDIPGQTIKILYEANDFEFSYTLIRSGSGNPSVLIDGEGRRYELCNKKKTGNTSNSFPDLSKSSKIILPKASTHPEYKISQSEDGLYLVTNKKTNTPIFYVANDNLYYSDQKHMLNFHKASSLIEDLKIGDKENWRLPTLFELEIIYGLKSQINPSPKKSMYWTSTKSDKNPSSTVMGIIFLNGNIVQGVKRGSGRTTFRGFEDFGYTFAVRDINPKNKPKSEETIIVEIDDTHKIMIALNGLSNIYTRKTTFDVLNNYILELNQNNFKNYNNWRLPTIHELRVFYKNMDVLKDVEYFNNDKYYNFLWSSTSSTQNRNEYYVKNFKDGEERNDYIGNPTGSGIFVWNASALVIRDVNSINQPVVDNESNVNTKTAKSKTDILTDPRDGKSYKTVKIGEQWWMSENLGYDAGNDCWSYDNNEEYVIEYGRLYTWEVSIDVCPSGWHLPTREEWSQLERVIGNFEKDSDVSFNKGSSIGIKLKSSDGWKNNGNGTNEFGFSGLPGGYRTINGDFYNIMYSGYWWSLFTTRNVTELKGYILDETDRLISDLAVDKPMGFSVRCVKNEE